MKTVGGPGGGAEHCVPRAHPLLDALTRVALPAGVRSTNNLGGDSE